jgi:hypothetical protein
MRARQRGAGLLIPVVLVITVAAFAVIVAASQAGGDIQGSDANADSLQALLLAETGIERQLKRFAAGTACTALGDDPGTVPVEATHAISDLNTIGLGLGVYSIAFVNGLTNDFAGGNLPATQCRIAVTARVVASNVVRTVHAIVDRNLLEGPDNPPGPDNPAFDNPLWTGAPPGPAPSAWVLSAGNRYAMNGGPDGTFPNCRRSAWLARGNQPANPANDRRASGTLNVAFTVTPGSTTTISFHRRFVDRGVGCPADVAGLPVVGFPCPAAATQGTICFRMTGTGGAGVWTSANHDINPVPGPGIAACPTTFNPCATSYQAGYPTKITLPGLVMVGATSVATFSYHMRVQNGGRKEMFLDNIEVTNPTAVGAAHVKVWRDCSTAACP